MSVEGDNFVENAVHAVEMSTTSISSSPFLMYQSNPLFSLEEEATWKCIRFSDISMTAERSVEMKFDGVFSELSEEEKVQFQGQVHNKLTPRVPKVVLDNYQCTEGRKCVSMETEQLRT